LVGTLLLLMLVRVEVVKEQRLPTLVLILEMIYDLLLFVYIYSDALVLFLTPLHLIRR
jgi:hypothetical protein